MEKALEILEKNVQWLVLGLAGLFLAWVAYAYIVTPPAVVKLDNRPTLPGDVAQRTHDGPVRELDDQIKRNTADFPTPDLVTAWQQKMVNPAGVRIASGPNGPFNSLVGKEVLENPNPGQTIHIAALPVLPPASPQVAMAGKSVVQNPPPANNPNANQNAAQPVAQQPRDLEWVTAAANIPAADLSAALTAVLKGQQFDPTQLAAVYNTELLQVVMQRQAAVGTDAQGNPVFPEGNKGIEPVEPVVLDPTTFTPMPAPTDGDDVKYKYIDWAGQNSGLIAQPAFYPVTAGDPWNPPQPAAPGATPGTPASAPAATPAPAPRVTPPAPAPAPAGNPPGKAAPPSAKPAHGGQARANFSPAGIVQPGQAGFGGAGFQPPPANIVQPNFNPNPGGNATGPGQINPFDIQSDILIWAHDQNVKPGQTYRYRFIYKIKNPVFGTNMADKKLTSQFALESKPSAWSAPVTVPQTTRFWVAAVTPKMDSATLDEFNWAGGAWTPKHMKLSPGDAVPGTTMTVVDIRAADPKGKDKYVLLASEDGRLETHNLAADLANPDYTDLQNQVNNPTGQGVAPAPPPTPAPRPTIPPNGSRIPRGGNE